MTPTAQNPSSRQWRLLAIGAILIIAALLRAPALDRVPPGFWSDEALNGMDAWAVWQPGGHFKIVYSDLFPREPFYETLLAFVVKAAGPSVVAMRSLSVAIGVFTVLLLYLFLRGEAGERAALCSAAVLATMRWHVIFSRLIFRTLVLPAWICGLVWAAFSWRRNPTLWRATLFGVLLGGGFYTYLAWYFMLPLAGVLVVWAAAAEVRSRNGRIRLAIALCIAALVAAPILYHYLAYPKDLLDRPGAVSPFANGFAAGMAEIGQNLGEAVVMFFWFGDHVPLQNIPGKAALDFVQMIFFAWGLVLCLLAIRRRVLAPILILWLMCGIAPTVFTMTDSPNFLRSLVATPAVAALTGIGLADIAGMIGRRKPAAAISIVCLAIAVSAGLTARDIYLVWPHREDVWGRFHGPAVQIANFANEASADSVVFVPKPFTEGRPYQFITLAAAKPGNIHPFSALPSAPARRIVIVPNDDRILRALGPNSRTLKTFSTPTGKIWGVAVRIGQ